MHSLPRPPAAQGSLLLRPRRPLSAHLGPAIREHTETAISIRIPLKSRDHWYSR